MKEQGREPMKVEPGQHWRYNEAKFVVVERHPTGGWVIEAEGDYRPFGTRYWFLDAQFRESCVYLGGPSPSPEGAGRVMEATSSRSPVACLRCGGDKGARLYTCEACCAMIGGTKEWSELADAWDAGARDFPRSPAAAPAPAATVCGRKGMLWADGRWKPCPGCAECPRSPAPVPVAAKPVKVFEQCMAKDPANGYLCVEKKGHGGLHHSMIGPWKATLRAPEMQSQGIALSALQAIQSRPKPEPWVPTVDDDHWIPSVGERGSR